MPRIPHPWMHTSKLFQELGQINYASQILEPLPIEPVSPL